MKNIFTFLLIILSIGSFAQTKEYCAKVLDNDDNPIANAAVLIVETATTVYSDANGNFCFNASDKAATLQFSNALFQSREVKLELSTYRGESIYLNKKVFELDEAVIVSSTRMDETKIKTATTLKAADLKKLNTGQDLPVLLNGTPSLVYTSDAGNGIGYTQFRIRGMDLTRINVTVNGVPINDQESHGVWWVNMPDISSSINSIQVQRGVGTSTNGGQAFGSSVNIETDKMKLEPSAQIALSAGSFNSHKATAEFSTGLLENNWGFSGRLSKIYSDGFIDRAFSDLKSFYFAAHYLNKKQSLRITAFSGKERTYQAWNGIGEDDLINNRTFNPYTYEDQTDNYQQDHYQLHYTRYLSDKLKANGALHYTLGRGYFEEYRDEDDLSFYGLDDINLGDTSISSSDIIRQRWLYNHFLGGIYSLEYKNKSDKGTSKITFGGNYNQYFGDHYGEVIWARYASESEIGDRYYENDAFKRNLNNYLKYSFETTRLSFQAEAQLRSVHYAFEGITDDLKAVDHSVDYLFFNPKAMFGYNANSKSRFYAYYGKSSREPLRNDFVEVEPRNWPTHETVHDVEMGLNHTGKNVGFNVNLYYMHFQNQLVQNGRINDVGANLRVNVPQSYRRGIEVEMNAKLAKNINWTGNITLSQNKIIEWVAFVEQYDADFNWLGQKEEINYNTDISFSPNAIGFSNFEFTLIDGMSLNLQTKFVGEQYLDNTQSEERRLDPYVVNDLIINYTIEIPDYFKIITFQAMAYNFMNEMYEASGWTWMYDFDGTRSQLNGYYPQAGRNIMVGVVFGF